MMTVGHRTSSHYSSAQGVSHNKRTPAPPDYVSAPLGHRLLMQHDGDASSSSLTSESDRASDKTPPPRLISTSRLLRIRADRFLHSLRCQMCILASVMLIVACVLTTFLIRLKAIPSPDGHRDNIIRGLFLAVLVFLAAQLVEMGFKLLIWRKKMLKEKMELFDLCLVVATLALHLCFGLPALQSQGGTLLIAIRLWRIQRIYECMVAVVKTEADHRAGKERRARRALEREVAKLREYCLQQECELQMYRMMLQDNNIPQPTVLRAPTQPRTLNVIVEVNEHECNTINGTGVDDAGCSDQPPPDYDQTMAEYIPLQHVQLASPLHSD